MNFWSALLLGLASSFHCAAMCGGFSCLALAGGGARGPALLAVNAGRLTTYCTVAALLAAAGAAGWQWLPPAWTALPRLLTGAALAAVGLHILFGIRLLTPLERAGRRLFKAVTTPLRPLLRGSGNGGRFVLGVSWGLLPCGLVYYVWIMAAASGGAAAGALIALGFGLGTLPALLGAGALLGRLKQAVGPRLGRRAAGCSILMIAVWVSLLPLLSAPPIATATTAAAPMQCH